MIELWGYSSGQMREFVVSFYYQSHMSYRAIVDRYGFDQLQKIEEIKFPLVEQGSKTDLFGNKQNSVYHHNYTGKLIAPFRASSPDFIMKTNLVASLIPATLEPKNATIASQLGYGVYESAYSVFAMGPTIDVGRFYMNYPYYGLYDITVQYPSPYSIEFTIVRVGRRAIADPSLLHISFVRGDQGTFSYSMTGRDGATRIQEFGERKFGESCIINLPIGGYMFVQQSDLFTLTPMSYDLTKIFQGGRQTVGVANDRFDFFPSAYSAVSSLSTLRVNNYENLRDLLETRGQLAMIKATYEATFTKSGFIKALAATFLAFQYAIKPLISDVSDAAEFQSTLSDNGRYKAYGISTQTFKSCVWTLRTEVIGQYNPSSVAERLLQLLDRCGLGLNTSTMWELIPFSFVLNWIFPVSDILRRLDLGITTVTYNKYNVDTCITSAKTTIPWKGFSSFTGTITETIYIREVSDFMPISSPTGNVNVTLGKHVVELAALFVSRSK